MHGSLLDGFASLSSYSAECIYAHSLSLAPTQAPRTNVVKHPHTHAPTHTYEHTHTHTHTQCRYRKIAGDLCVGGVENQYLEGKELPCPGSSHVPIVAIVVPTVC